MAVLDMLYLREYHIHTLWFQRMW